jgi:hypothetical protein
MTGEPIEEPIPTRSGIASGRASGRRGKGTESYSVDASHAGSPVLVARAESLYQERRRRDATLGGTNHLFGEPSWDILLDLFIAWGRARPVSVSSACIASSTPQSTALRYVGLLERVGFIRRSKDPRDGRRQYVELTDLGLSEMKAYLAE